MNAAKKRAGKSLALSLFLLLVYPLILVRACLLLTTITMGMGWMILALIFAALILANTIRAFIRLKKAQQAQREGRVHFASEWKKGRVPYLSRKIIMKALGIILVCTLARVWEVSVTGGKKIPLDEYDGTLPFATMKDFAGDGYTVYEMIMTGTIPGVNTVEEKSDWLAPRCIAYDECATVNRADGQRLSGDLCIDFYEVRNPTSAKMLARELYRRDRLKKSFEPLEAPELQTDYTVTYMYYRDYPTVIIQKGNTVIRAHFSQIASDYGMYTEEWAQIICDSMGK